MNSHRFGFHRGAHSSSLPPMRIPVLMLLLALLAASCADPRGPVVVEDANSKLGGTILVRRGDTAWKISQEAGVPVRPS